jgi:predicted MPP superfamily phosphohydrolase
LHIISVIKKVRFFFFEKKKQKTFAPLREVVSRLGAKSMGSTPDKKRKMIRILYMSDLHIEMERWRLSVPGWAAFRARHQALAAHPSRGPLLDNVGPADLVVLAGDIHNGLRGLVYAEQVAQYLAAPVVYVAGNHEFYNHDMTSLLPALARAAEKTKGRVYFLENSAKKFVIRGQTLNVLGCTLWTDYELHGTPVQSMMNSQRRMNDHRFIEHGSRVFSPQDALDRHLASRAWLLQTLTSLRRDEPGAKTLVVTHHAPSGLVLGDRNGDIAPAYGSNLLPAFAPVAPTAWIHGHTHHRHESMESGIRLLSAPRGYVVYDGAALDFCPGILEI